MANEIDLSKLEKFTEAAISNPLHPVYLAGWRQSPILQYWATNVHMLQSVTPAQFFEQHPDWTQRLNEAMAYCEAEQAKADAEQTEEQKLRAQVDDLSGKVNTLLAQIATLTPAAPAADTPNAAA